MLTLCFPDRRAIAGSGTLSYQKEPPLNSSKTLPVIVVLVAGAAALYWAVSKFRSARPQNPNPIDSPPAKTGDPFFDSAPPMMQPDSEAVRKFTAIEVERNRWNETTWAEDMVAERHGDVFIRLWDELRNTNDKFSALEGFPFGKLIAGEVGRAEQIEQAIERTRIEGPVRAMDRDQWKQQLRKLKDEGFRLEQSEWRHPRFIPGTNGPARSVIAMTLHIGNPTQGRRIILKGDLSIEWETPADPLEPPFPREIDATHLEMLARSDAPAFAEVVVREFIPHEGTIFIDPLMLHDLDGDGLSEIILGCSNLIFHNRGAGRFDVGPLCAQPPGLINTAVIADFNGDGAADFLCCDREGLSLYAGDGQGRFVGERRRVWPSSVALMNPFVMTCGDIEHDGDLDVWLAQYKLPYYSGQMPTPYYDANDGFPSFLLVNNGDGSFRDSTEPAGLNAKRFRRTYSSSFVDLDEDADLDLVVVSDFAGADVFYNDGRGRFTDATAKVLDEPRAFGMAHSFGDFDGDGQLDFLMIGMNSYVAQRLDWLNAGPPEFPQHQLMRPKMGYGNRLYLRRGGVFRQELLSDQVARTGWSWGCSSFDFDNDGDLDLYVANGHKSRQSAKDYESQFWRHDIYTASSRHDPAMDLYFGATGERLYGSGHSYGGYEKNRLLMNLSGKGFLEVGHLMGVALEEDCRNVVSDDLDGDGKLDLLFTTFEDWPVRRQALHIFQNRSEHSGNWIGVHLGEKVPGDSPIGATVSVTSQEGKQTRRIVTGDSYRSQSSSTAHFGLGKSTNAVALEVRWLNGRTKTVVHPEINRYHRIVPDHD
jgi:ASPIC/UnbV protein/VCBS repeat protein